MRFIKARDRGHRVAVAPFQRPGILGEYGLTVGQCESGSWAIGPQCERFHGAGAMNLAYAVATGSRWPMRLYLVPGVRQAQELVYRFIARYRNHLPGDVPHCIQLPGDCCQYPPAEHVAAPRQEEI